MEKILNKITETIESYESGKYLTTEALREHLRVLTSQVYYLTKYKIEAKNRHNEIEYKNKKSVAFGKILAHEQVPELYQIRYILRSAQNVIQSIIMEISILKNES